MKPRDHLLPVEDDAKLVRVLRRGLEQEGYVVDVAYTAKKALACVGTADYGVVVLDVILPDGDGFAVCELLRRARLTVPVLMMTARSDVMTSFEAWTAEPTALRYEPV